MEDKSMKFTKLTILAGSFLLLFSLSSAGENAVKKEIFLSINQNIKNVALRAELEILMKDFDANLYVVKAQIHAGGRGKAGGVKVVRDKEEAKKQAHEMFGKTLVTHQTGPEGQVVKRVYIESGCDITKEYYFSIVRELAWMSDQHKKNKTKIKRKLAPATEIKSVINIADDE